MEKQMRLVIMLPSKNEALLSLGGVGGCAGGPASPQLRSKVPRMMNIHIVMLYMITPN